MRGRGGRGGGGGGGGGGGEVGEVGEVGEGELEEELAAPPVKKTKLVSDPVIVRKEVLARGEWVRGMQGVP